MVRGFLGVGGGEKKGWGESLSMTFKQHLDTL